MAKRKRDQKPKSAGGSRIQPKDVVARKSNNPKSRVGSKQEKVLGLEFEGTYHDVGTVSGFLKTSIAFALERPGLREELLSFLKSLNGVKPA